MKILITGGCGFLGSNLAEKSIKDGNEVLIFDNLSRIGGQENFGELQKMGEFKFIQGDIRNSNDVEQCFKNFTPEIVFHVAGQVAMTTSLEDPRKDFEINTLGTFNLLENIRQKAPNAHLIYSSTNKVYGDLEHLDYLESDLRYELPYYQQGLPETTPLDFSTPYGCSKGAADQYVRDYTRTFNLCTTVFRHSSIFGPRQYGTYHQGWVSWFVQQALKQKTDSQHTFTISGNGKQVRDILSADDLVNCYFKAIEHRDHTRGQIYNIGGGLQNSFSLLELFNLLDEKLGTQLNFEKIPVRKSDQKVFIADIRKAKQDFDWEPLVTATSAIDEMIQWSEAKIF